MKNKIFVFKHSFSTALSVICVQTGSYLKDRYHTLENPIAFFIFLIFVYAFSYKLPGLIAKFMMRRRFVRKYLAGRNFVEGIWHIMGYDNSSENKLTRDGIGIIEYNSEDEYEITVIRLNDDYSDTFETHSKSFIFNSSMECLNQFSCTVDGKEITGTSTGIFSIHNRSPIVNVYNGKITTNDYQVIKQKGVRFDDLVVKSYEKRYGENWTKDYLLEQIKTLRITA